MTSTRREIDAVVGMVERVARAIARCETEDDWDGLGSHWREQFTKEARAAIEAMREPTEAMLQALDNGDADFGWSCAIDAALK